jgi:uroporphyrinogen III methyltransferase/synthase
MQPALVSLVGAGPGHPGLLTVRAVELLREADLVLYDKLVPPAMLDYASPRAEKRCVTELAAHHVERQIPVQEMMIAAAREGKRVVRLKGGDPCLFGRAGEEALALRAAGIPFEIIPGITAALGAASFAGIPLTHRQHASAVAFLTGHENPDKAESALDWAALARFPGTLVVYMGMSRLDKIARVLIDQGKDPKTPAAVVQHATSCEQRTVEAPLAELPQAVRAAGLSAPAVILIGSVVSLRAELNWFEKLPLFGKRVLVTRPRHQAGDLAQRLLQLGAVPQLLPAVEIREPADWGPVDAALRDLSAFAWLVFTSANGVHALLGRLLSVGRDLRALGSLRLAAIGPKTAAALGHYHLVPDLVPAQFQSEDLSAALLDRIEPGRRVLLARADRGRDLLRQELSRCCAVEQVAVYSQVDAIDAGDPMLDHVRRGEIDFITLTSSNIARALVRSLDATSLARLKAGEIRLISISPVTSADIRALGLPVAAEASVATTEGIVEALLRLVEQGTINQKQGTLNKEP